MRVMIHGVPPWAPSGYGVQGALLARGLRDAGHDVTISAYGGFLREEPWRCPVQPAWNKLHNAWWHVPVIASLADCLEDAYRHARDPQLRREAKLSAAQYHPEVVIPQWTELLEGLG